MDTTVQTQAATVTDTSKFRLLHTMIRVMDLEKSLDFYSRLLGMKVLRRKEREPSWSIFTTTSTKVASVASPARRRTAEAMANVRSRMG